MEQKKVLEKVVSIDCPFIIKSTKQCKIYETRCVYYRNSDNNYCFIRELNKLSRGQF